MYIYNDVNNITNHHYCSSDSSALELARVGANVIVAARSENKGNEAVQKIKQEVEGASVQYLPLDLASFESIKQFADKFHELDTVLDVLLLNAGVMKSPGAQFIGQELQESPRTI